MGSLSLQPILMNFRMKHFLRLFSLLFSFSLIQFSQGQTQKGDLVDGIAAVIGKEIILESDIAEQLRYAQQQNLPNANRCDFAESLLSNKFVIDAARKDTTIQNRSKEIQEVAAKKLQQMQAQFPSEKAMLEFYKFRNIQELRNLIEKMDIDQYYAQQKFAKITDGTDVTPAEVTDFFEKFHSELPSVKDEVVLSHIQIKPRLSEEHRKEIINKLMRIRQDILSGKETFETQARIYSEDQGSATTGGLYQKINRGQMVKIFEATALNLQEGEISEPVESEFGFHIIRLEGRHGKNYDARHILIKATPKEDEIADAKKKMNLIREQIINNKISFKDAVIKYSEDKDTKFNAGRIVAPDGSDRHEKSLLDPTTAYRIAGLNSGDLTDVYVMEDERTGPQVTLTKVEEYIPEHTLQMATDYERIRTMALNRKKGEVVDQWIRKRTGDVFIQISPRYRDCNFKTDWLKKNQ